MTEKPNSSAGGFSSDLTFGECQGLCGRMVERVGWDSYCFECQEEMKAEQDETFEDLYDHEDQFLYGGGLSV